MGWANSSVRSLQALPALPQECEKAKGVVMNDPLSAAFYPHTWDMVQRLASSSKGHGDDATAEGAGNKEQQQERQQQDDMENVHNATYGQQDLGDTSSDGMWHSFHVDRHTARNSSNSQDTPSAAALGSGSSTTRLVAGSSNSSSSTSPFTPPLHRRSLSTSAVLSELAAEVAAGAADQHEDTHQQERFDQWATAQQQLAGQSAPSPSPAAAASGVNAGMNLAAADVAAGNSKLLPPITVKATAASASSSPSSLNAADGLLGGSPKGPSGVKGSSPKGSSPKGRSPKTPVLMSASPFLTTASAEAPAAGSSNSTGAGASPPTAMPAVVLRRGSTMSGASDVSMQSAAQDAERDLQQGTVAAAPFSALLCGGRRAVQLWPSHVLHNACSKVLVLLCIQQPHQRKQLRFVCWNA